MRRVVPFLGLLAAVQIALPAPPARASVVVQLCGGGTMELPVGPRGPSNDKQNSSCCGKLCHVNERKRSSGQCCGPEDDPDED